MKQKPVKLQTLAEMQRESPGSGTLGRPACPCPQEINRLVAKYIITAAIRGAVVPYTPAPAGEVALTEGHRADEERSGRLSEGRSLRLSSPRGVPAEWGFLVCVTRPLYSPGTGEAPRVF